MSLKGRLISITGGKFLSSYLKPYADMLNFSVEPDTKTITLEILPKGEPSPIKITLTGYEISQSKGKPVLRVAKTSASREWIGILLEQFLQGKEVELPSNVAPLLKLLL
jgi:hypothetical protein